MAEPRAKPQTWPPRAKPHAWAPGWGSPAAAVLLGAVVLIGCATPTLTDAISENAGGGIIEPWRVGSEWAGYLPRFADFPMTWRVLRVESLPFGSVGGAATLDEFLLQFGAPPARCALPKDVFARKDHVDVQAEPSPPKGRIELPVGADLHLVQVQVGPAGNSLVEQLRALPADCASFPLTRKSGFDSSYQAIGSIIPADPKLGFGDAAAIAYTLATGSSLDPGSTATPSLIENVYAATVKEISVIAISVSFKDASADGALALKLFQETAERVNAS